MDITGHVAPSFFATHEVGGLHYYRVLLRDDEVARIAEAVVDLIEQRARAKPAAPPVSRQPFDVHGASGLFVERRLPLRSTQPPEGQEPVAPSTDQEAGGTTTFKACTGSMSPSRKTNSVEQDEQ